MQMSTDLTVTQLVEKENRCNNKESSAGVSAVILPGWDENRSSCLLTRGRSSYYPPHANTPTRHNLRSSS